MNWPFDQERNVATLTTQQVARSGLPVLLVTHYADDHSWLFACGTTNNMADYLIVGMGEVVDLDETLLEVADLPPGWSATRTGIGGDWRRYEGE